MQKMTFRSFDEKRHGFKIKIQMREGGGENSYTVQGGGRTTGQTVERGKVV